MSHFYIFVFTPTYPFAVTLAKGKVSHSLLLRRFAPRKVVCLLPDKRGQLTFRILFSHISTKSFILSAKRNSPLHALLGLFVLFYFFFAIVLS